MQKKELRWRDLAAVTLITLTRESGIRLLVEMVMKVVPGGAAEI